MEVLLPSSSSSSTFSTFNPGSRAIDRHNPIIMDERRSGISTNNGSCASTPIRTPCTHHVLQKKPPTPNNSPKPLTPKKGNKLPTLTKKKTSKTRNNVTNNTTTTTTTTTAKSPVYSKSDIVVDGDDDNDGGGGGYKGGGRRSFSKPSELIMKAAAACANTRAGVDYVSPPESSRYLLDDTSFLEVLSDFDPVLELKPPFDDFNDINDDVEVVTPECVRPPKPPSSTGSSIGSPDQVVVLRVSLHCRGCERKMKKHLSRMPGVTSFNIDFAAKQGAATTCCVVLHPLFKAIIQNKQDIIPRKA
ncbi:hypothetical protein SOVF_042580 [Spinacia oleracea]|nr:hypothetical protein SOVF_042580 [Spinacia oleracea]